MHFVEQPVDSPWPREILPGLVAGDDLALPVDHAEPAQQRVDDRAREALGGGQRAGAGVCLLRTLREFGFEILEGGDVGQGDQHVAVRSRCALRHAADRHVENAAIRDFSRT